MTTPSNEWYEKTARAKFPHNITTETKVVERIDRAPVNRTRAVVEITLLVDVYAPVCMRCKEPVESYEAACVECVKADMAG